MQIEQEIIPNTIGLIDIVRTLLKRKKIILISIFGFLLIAVVFALVVTKQYKSVLLALPVADEEQSASAKLGGFASLLGGASKGDRSQFSFETLKSRDFAGKIIVKHDLMPEILPDRWDSEKKSWILDDNGKPPSLSLAITVFQENNLSIEIDQKTGLITLEVTWSNAQKAAVIANDFIDVANQFLREKAIIDSKSSMQYLKDQIAETQEIEVKEMLYGLVQKELQITKVAQSKQDYAFEVIDPAVPADYAAKPKKKLIVVIGVMTGTLFGILIAFFMDYIWPSILIAKRNFK